MSGFEQPGEFACPCDLVQRLDALGRCLSSQDWRALSGFLHPGYQGRRGFSRYLAAEEEIKRLRDEITAPEFVRGACRFRLLAASVEGTTASLAVEERLVLTRPDGCSRATVRQFEQHWQFEDRRWLLIRTERLPHREERSDEAALASEIPGNLAEAEWLLGSPGPATHLGKLARSSVLEMLAWAPSPRLAVQLDPGDVPPYAAEAFQRACYSAMRAWNHCLTGCIELYEHDGKEAPDILVRAWNRPIYGEALGVALNAFAARCSDRRPGLAEVRVVVVERSGSGALCPSPPELFATVCHELGHCFGLDECTCDGTVMGSAPWTMPPPAARFLAERRTIARWLGTCHRLRARAFRQLGQEERAEREDVCAMELEREANRENLGAPPMGLDLLDDVSYAPETVRHYWEGTAHLQRGRLEQALASYNHALEGGDPSPEALQRRGWTKLLMGDADGLKDLEHAVELAPAWLGARECLHGALKSSGCETQAERHRIVLERLTSRAKLEEHLFAARTSRVPWQVRSALGGVARWGIRYAITAVRRGTAERIAR